MSVLITWMMLSSCTTKIGSNVCPKPLWIPNTMQNDVRGWDTEKQQWFILYTEQQMQLKICNES